jgi:UDP-N-acetylglucosamine--N-acetylmuramyl-(pentapeptide) pyrophosphoryl-undecaprenol N-acetylglucosamine transferase
VLVPSPHVTADHQSANARHLERLGAAVVVPDAELDGSRLMAEVDALLSDPARLAAMAQAARAGARPHAADDIARLAEEHARGQ